MKNQPSFNDGGQGTSTANRAYNDPKEVQKQKGVTNGGGQRSDQTSNKDSAHQPQKKQH